MTFFSNNRARLVRNAGWSALATVLMSAAGIAHAQSTPETGSSADGRETQQERNSAMSDGEIIVTALKGGVSAQKVPVTVNIVSGDAIVSKGLTSVEQLTAAVPGVRINQAPGGLVNPVVRGLGSSPSNNSFEQTVGLFIDGIFAGHPRDYSAALFDLDRVELLKGTQSAVVGKNTSVGALTLVTRKPDFEFGAEGSYYHEFELGTDTLNAAINVPLSDSFAIRLAGLYSNEGGWMRSAFGGKDTPSVERTAVRLTARYSPNVDLDWTMSFQYADMSLDGQFFRTGIDTLGNSRRNAVLGGDTGYALERFTSRNTFRTGFSYRGLDRIGGENDGIRLNSTLNYSFGDITLTSVTGYSEYDDIFIIDAADMVNSPVLRAGFETDKAFSQELRLATDPSKPFSLLVGGYYYHDKWTYEDLFDFNGAQMTAPSLGGAFQSSYRQTTETFSLFGQLLYKFSDRFQVSGSARAERFNKDGDYSARTIQRPGGLTIAVYGAYPAFSRTGGKSYFDYSLQGQYFITPDTNVYASYSTGTKGFGFVATPTSPGGVVTDPFFDTENSRTIEGGIKSNFAPGSSINFAVFDTRLRDYQIGVNLGTRFVIRNDQVRSRGAEAQVNLQIIDGLRASMTATYADVKKIGTLPANSIRGLPFAPKWSGIANLAYETGLTSELRLKSDVTAEFRSSQALSDATTFPLPRVPGRVRTDIRLGVEHEPSGVEVALIVRNLFDVYALNYGFNQAGASGAAQVAEEMPRTIGVQASFRF